MRGKQNHTVGYRAVLAAALIILLMPLSHAGAAAKPQPGPGNGLRISPVRTDATVQPGHSQTINLSVTNVTGAAASFQAIINDFVASPDESGNPSIIFDPTKFAPSHSLKRYVGPVSVVTLQPGEEKNVPIVVNIPANAAGGGYYGAVRFAPATPNLPNTQLSLSGSVGSLILVKVPGNIKEQVGIAGIDVVSGKHHGNFFTSSKDMNVVLRFKNTGNIQEAPFGKLQVKNRGNKTIGSYELNNIVPAGNVLPDSTRRFVVPIKTGGFGQYKIEGNFGYGSAGQLLSVATTIYIIPLPVIIAFVVVVVLLAVAIFGVPRLIKIYNRGVLRRAGRR